MTVWDTVVKALEPFGADSLVDVCTVVRTVRGNRQPGGSYDETLTTILTGVPCRVTPTSLASSEAMVAEALDVLNRWQVAVWRGTDLQTDDQITATGVDNDGNAWTRVLVVISVDGPRSYQVLWTATCSELSTSGR